jgi:hypothetical protein
MPSLLTTHRKEAAKALLQLANSDKQIASRYYLRNRSIMNQPNPPRRICRDYSKNNSATLEDIIAAVATFDNLIPSPPKTAVSARYLRDRHKINKPDRLLYSVK